MPTDPVTAIALAVAELARAHQQWFGVQTLEVQQASGNHWLKFLTAIDALCDQMKAEGSKR